MKIPFPDEALTLGSPRRTDSARPSADSPRCPVEATLDVLDRRKTLIVWHLFWGGRPFCELMRQTPGISRSTLRGELAQMQTQGLVRREVRPGSVRKADYSLTPLGESLKPILAAMYQWGLQARREVANGPSRGPAPLSTSVRELPSERAPIRVAWHC